MKMKTKKSEGGVAYSYIRFSSPAQADGDSLRRQTEAAALWCSKNNIPLDTSLTLHDKGCSAWKGLHRDNPDKHALALFLKLVERDRVHPGDYLLVENLDRLTREEEVPACHLLTGILMAGVRVVQLSPYEMLLTEKSNGWELMRAVMELSRGHGESAIKSDRVRAAWQMKKRKAREDGTPVSGRLPSWVRQRGGRLELVPEAAASVKRIFDLARAGYGYNAIVKALTKDKAPGFGRTGRWTHAHVLAILTDRRAVGEYQPRRRNGDLDGDPISNYYPSVVSDDEWHAARAAIAERKKSPGRLAKVHEDVNVFAGLLKNALGDDSYHLARWGSRRRGKSRAPVLRTTDGSEGRAKDRSFPFHAFEWAILSCLREIDPHEILNGDSGPDEAQVLGGQLADVETELAEVSAFMDENGFSDTLGKRVVSLEGKKKELAEKLAAARRKAAFPLSEAWGETQSLASALDAAADQLDARLRLKAALRRIVSGIWMVVVGRGRSRLCAVQVWFMGGERHRDYLVFHRPRMMRPNCPPEPEQRLVRSLIGEDSPSLPRSLDLRDRGQAAALAQVLEGLDLARLTG
jgi:DNA invertase Pin-like site-specific DNA recombinase